MKKNTKRLLSLMLSLILVVGMIPGTMTAHAAGTESSPVYVTNFAELKAELEKDEDSYIVVNEFEMNHPSSSGNYYNLNENYTNDGDFAIRVAYDRTKTLVVNTTIDCRSTASNKVLSSFIYNPSNLTIMGNGTINIGFCLNTREVPTKNSVIHNAGTLTVKGNVTLTTENTMQYSNGHAIHNDGTATIEGGTFVGFCNMLDSYGDNQVDDTATAVINSTAGAMTIKDGIFRASTLRTGEAAHGLYSVNTGISISGGVFNGIESNTTMVAEATDEPISSFLASGYEYRKVTDDTVFDGSSISETGDSLYVAPTGSVKHSITVSDGSASHTKAFAGTMVTLTANAAPDGMVFDKWEVVSGGVTIEDNKFEMPNADVEIKAVYKVKSVTITATASPAEGGTVTGSGEYTISEQVFLTAIPNAGYKFVRWEENGIEVRDLSTYSFDVTPSTTDRNLVAVFEVDSTVPQPTEIESADAQVTVPVAGANPSFTATPSDSDKYTTVVGVWYDYTLRKELTEGDTFVAGHKYDLRVVFTAKAGYTFDSNTVFTINGNSTNSYSTTYGYREIRFEVPEEGGDTPPTEYDITVTGGTASANKAVAGAEITLTVDESAIPAGKVFDKWEVVSGGVTVADGKFTMPESAVEINATYKDAPVSHICDIKPVAKVEPSCTEGGKEAYYKCDGCGKCYEDALGAKEITDIDAWGNLEKLGHTESDWKYDKDNHWKECTVTACGVIIEDSKAAHKDDNKDGKCDVCEYDVGLPTNPDNPETDDNSMIWLWCALLFASGAGVVATTVYSKKRSSAK